MELRYLRYFAAVAELKNFTRAAEKLRIAQPAVSQQIKTLEDELGVKLLIRTKRSVSITAAGQAFLREANEILAQAEKSKVVARRASRGEIGTLSIGCFSAASAYFLPELIQLYRTRFPAVRVHLYEQTPLQQLDALEAGRIDLGLTRPLPATHTGQFIAERVYRDRAMVLLPDRHPLAKVPRIGLEKLAGDDWVFFKRSEGPELVDGFMQLCAIAGFSPKIVSEPPMMITLVMMVAAGVGVALVPSCVSSFKLPGVRFIPLRPAPPPIDLVAARPVGEPQPTVAAFLDLLRQKLPAIRSRYENRNFDMGRSEGGQP